MPMLQRLSLLGAESLPDLLGEAWEADPGTARHGPWHGPNWEGVKFSWLVEGDT